MSEYETTFAFEPDDLAVETVEFFGKSVRAFNDGPRKAWVSVSDLAVQLGIQITHAKEFADDSATYMPRTYFVPSLEPPHRVEPNTFMLAGAAVAWVFARQEDEYCDGESFKWCRSVVDSKPGPEVYDAIDRQLQGVAA